MLVTPDDKSVNLTEVPGQTAVLYRQKKLATGIAGVNSTNI
jgi:hypothetical protein